MSTPASRIAEDLHDVVAGDILVDPVACALYGTDASIFQVQPLAVVVPRDEGDVLAVVRYARDHGLPITARGAGSGLAGECLGAGIILDFSKHFRSLGPLEGDEICVQPGVVLQTLADYLAQRGRRFAPDPASAAQCTVGGVLANNASGARAIKHGYARDHVASVRAVFSDATVAWLGREELNPANDAPAPLTALAHRLADLLRPHADLIKACQPPFRFNRCGYQLRDAFQGDVLDWPRLLVGSEGTLALFTEARLCTIPLPVERRVVLLGFASLEEAARAAPWVLEEDPSACDLLDRRLLALACEHYPEYEQVVTGHVQAALLVEFEGDACGEAQRAANRVARASHSSTELVARFVTTNAAETAWLWRLRDLALPLLHALPGKAQPIPYLEDAAVPCEHLAAFLARIQEAVQRHGLVASLLVHAGAGQVHVRPFLDWTQPDAAAKLESLASEVYRWALDLGGTISSQHAVGMARTPWVAQQYGRLYQVMREVKLLLDPDNLLNPGKIVDAAQPPGAAPVPPLASLRRPAMAAAPHSWRLGWANGGVAKEANHCNGCAACRTQAAAQRMCPLFRVRHDEAATPRAKANLFRDLLGGVLPWDALTTDDVRAIADLCVNCRMCAIECPAHVDVPRLMLEAKAQHVAERGLRWSDWVLARTENFASLGSALAPLVNAALRSHLARWLLERVFGISQRRNLPALAPRSFLSMAARRGWTQLPRRPGVAYFVDVFANYNDPQIAEAAVLLLHHHGIEVHVPPDQVGCGMAPLAYGDVDTARRMAEHNVRIFGDLARAGHAIVCSEPTAALMLKEEYPRLIDDPDVRLVADSTVELTTFLGRLLDKGRLRGDAQPLPLAVGHHVPCHVKALRAGVAGPRLLASIPSLRATTIDESCSGMAGTFGLKAENFGDSLAAGRPMLERLRQDDLQFGSSECSACRLQMEQGARKRSLHPVQYLALAHGLLPEVAKRLSVPKPRPRRRSRRR